MSGWSGVFPPVLCVCAATKAKRRLTDDVWGPLDETPKTPTLFISVQTHFWCRHALERHFLPSLCRQDSKNVGADIQMGPFVWVNKECFLHDRPILTFLPALVSHEHTLNPSSCVCVCVASPASPLHMAESWLTGKQPSFFLINQWYAREGGFRSRRWGVSLNKRCWWWSGCCIISASEHLSSPRRASAINCTKLENDIWGRIILSAVISKQKRQNGGKNK